MLTGDQAYILSKEYTDAHGGGSGGTTNYPDLTNKPQINAVTLTGNKTASDLGLVATETGKGLSTNDFTDAEKTKLSGIETGAEVNVNADWTANSGDAEILHKPTLGTAAAKDSTNAVTENSTDLVESGAVYTGLAAKVNTSSVGTASGVAELDANGKVPSSQLPSFVDDVVEGYYDSTTDRFYEEAAHTTVISPESGKCWVDVATNKSYRWTGTVYVRVDEGVQIGETADTAYAGNKGKANADAITAIKDGSTIDSFGDVETALADKISKSQTAGLVKNDGTIDTTVYATTVSNGTEDDIVTLDSNGDIKDSGYKVGEITSTQWTALSEIFA